MRKSTVLLERTHSASTVQPCWKTLHLEGEAFLMTSVMKLNITQQL